MKNKLLIMSCLLISAITFAQKDQIKAAEKALKSGNPVEAQTLLAGADASIATAEPVLRAQYQFVKANIYNDMANKNTDVVNNQVAAGLAYAEVVAIENASGKQKFTDDAQKIGAELKAKLINAAVEEGKKENYLGSSKILKSIYDLDKTDLEKLYFAANYALNAKDYEAAYSYLQELKTLNYTGESTNYYAKNKISDLEEFFGNSAAAKTERDTKVKITLYTNPRDEKVESRKPEILKNMTFILLNANKNEEAKILIKEARAASPDDLQLILNEADLYFKLKDMDTFKKLTQEAIQRDPNNANLYFNLGVISANADQLVDAEKYYRKATEINPDYTDAYLNLAEVMLRPDEKFVKEMNKLGTTEKDTKRYDFLKAERNKLFSAALPILEKANDLSPTNQEVEKILITVYRTLDMNDKAKALKAKNSK